MNASTQKLNYQQVLLFARQLPLAERVRMVRDILAEPIEEQQPAEHEAKTSQKPPEPTRSMLGVCSHLEISLSEKQIDDARREMWGAYCE